MTQTLTDTNFHIYQGGETINLLLMEPDLLSNM